MPTEGEETMTRLLRASIAKVQNEKKLNGYGHQFGSEPKGLDACESFLRLAAAALVGIELPEIKMNIELLITDVRNLKAAAKDKYNDNE